MRFFLSMAAALAMAFASGGVPFLNQPNSGEGWNVDAQSYKHARLHPGEFLKGMGQMSPDSSLTTPNPSESEGLVRFTRTDWLNESCSRPDPRSPDRLPPSTIIGRHFQPERADQ